MSERVLYMDLEWDEITQEVKSVQMKYNGEKPIIKYPTDDNFIEEIAYNWNKIRAMGGVISFHNALPDLGHLATLGNNDFMPTEVEINEKKQRKDGGKKRTGGWKLILFGHEYILANLNNRCNFIFPVNDKKSPYILDTSKLFGLFIDSKTTKLKELAPKYLGIDMIPYTKENAETREYQEQDVVVPEQLYEKVFLPKVREDPDLAEYTNKDFAKICTTATTTRNAAEKAYPKISKWQYRNYKEIENWGLDTSFERAYMGGLTCAMYRCSQKHGPVKNTAWYDIKASYANVMKFLNVDQYNKLVFQKTDPIQPLSRNQPIFCKVVTNCVFRSVEDSLKVFEVEEKFETVMWSFDILSMRILFPNADITIIEAWRPIGLNFVTETLSGKWIEEKNRCKKGTAQYLHAKCKSNAYYGVRAQRDPKPTKFTNLPIAGMTTSRARLTLCEMVDEARKMGCQWLYSDTDSICVKLNDVNPVDLDKRLNKRINPYECECDFIGDTFVMAVKRYIATNGVDLEGNPTEDKISVHGRGQYDVDKYEFKRMVEGEILNRKLKLRQVQANTKRTYDRVKKLQSKIEEPCPFMFISDVETDEHIQDWFDNVWYPHIDTKTTFPEGCSINDEFERKFPQFRNLDQAENYYKEHSGQSIENNVLTEGDVIDWDRNDKIYFRDDPLEV